MLLPHPKMKEAGLSDASTAQTAAERSADLKSALQPRLRGRRASIVAKERTVLSLFRPPYLPLREEGALAPSTTIFAEIWVKLSP